MITLVHPSRATWLRLLDPRHPGLEVQPVRPRAQGEGDRPKDDDRSKDDDG